jgi:hypothetical protein
VFFRGFETASQYLSIEICYAKVQLEAIFSSDLMPWQSNFSVPDWCLALKQARMALW